MNAHELFSKTPPFRLFLMAALPGSVGMLASALYQLLDGVIVGRLLGETQFAALNFAMPFVIINFSLADLVGVGSAVPISISLGQREEAEANNIFTCSCLLIMGTGAAIGAALYLAAPALLGCLGAKGEFLRYAAAYMRVYAVCSPVTTIVFAVDNYLRICGRIKTSMILNIFMSALTAALEFIFVWKFRWGIGGAAAAACLGMCVSALIALFPFFRGKMLLRFCKPHFSMKMLEKIVECGTPNFLNTIAGRITSILLNAILLRVGGEIAVSVYGVLMYVEGCILPLLYGMCDSLQPAVSYNLGAGDWGRIHAIERCCYTASCILAFTSAALMICIPRQIASLFVHGAQEYSDMAVTALRLFALTYLTRWFSFATQSYMLAIDRSARAAAISVSTALIFPVAVLVLLWPLGLTGIWLNFAGTALLAGILSGVLLLQTEKEERR